MNEVLTIKGIDCYEKDGTVYLKLEAVARGLGFTEIAASGNECVKWSRVKKYLTDLKFIDTSVDGVRLPEFIPENIFYRLAMKAKNETAEKFQALVADEIIPSIRKHGIYATDQVINQILSDPDFGIRLLTQLKEERTARFQAEKKNDLLEKENDLLAQKTLEWADRSIINALVRAYAHSINNNFAIAWTTFKQSLLYHHGINLNTRQTIHLNNGGSKSKKKLDFLSDEELPQAIGTAVAMCRNNNVDISDILDKKTT